MEEINNEKRNNATISFTDKSQKEEVQAILHEPHLQKLMPPSVRGKDGKMVLWMVRYLRDIVELGVVPDFEREYTVPELGALYFQMKLEYDYWRDMISKTEQLVLHLAKSYGLADAEHPCVFDCKFEGGDSKIIIDLDCQAFSYHSLHSFVTALDQGGGFSIQVSVVNSHIHILYDISHTQGYVSPLDRYRDITELEEAVQEDEPLNYEGDPSGCDYYDNDYPLGEESPEGVADGDVPQDESPVTLAVEQEETDEKKNAELSGENASSPGSDVMLELKIVNLYNDGWSMTKIAKLIGRGKDFVRNRLKMNKVFIRRTSSKRRYVRFSDLTFAKKTEIALDYRTGFKVDDIKNKYRLSDYALYKVLEEKGVKLRSADKVKPLKNPPSELSQKIVEMYKAGATRKDIMLALGLEKDHVIYDSLRSAGVLSHEKAKGI